MLQLVTAMSDLPPGSALATVAASRPPRGADAFMTPLHQPNWEAAVEEEEEECAGESSAAGEACGAGGDVGGASSSCDAAGSACKPAI